MASTVSLARRIVLPLGLLVAALILPGHVLENPGMMAGMPGALGPTAWPTAALAGLGACAALWLVLEVLTFFRSGGRAAFVAAPAEDQDAHDNLRAILGLALTVLYGIAIPTIGFPLATLLFVIAWSALGGVRRPVVLASVSLIGTVALLYVFVRLALMPLNRGSGIFDQLTVGLYRLLGIY
jgi:putative tricarboxylic transport membrane protein